MHATSASRLPTRPSATNPNAAPAQRPNINEAIFDAARSHAWTAVHQFLANHEGTFEGQDAVGNTLSYFLIHEASCGIPEALRDLQQLIADNKLPVSSLLQANQFGKTPLHLVAERFNADIWQFLISYGANPQLGDNNHQSPLEILSAHNPDAARWLQQRSRIQNTEQDDLRFSNDDCSICLSKVNIKGHITPCGHKFHIACIRPWIENNAAVNQVCPNCKKSVNLEQLQPFIPDDNNDTNRGLPSAPPAYISYLNERDLPETIQGVEETKTEEPQMTREQAQGALTNAARTGNINVLRQVLNMPEIDVNAKDSYGTTPAIVAASANQIEALKVLAESGADLNKLDNNGGTAAHAAARNGHVEALTLLANRGANLHISNNNGCTPAYLAAASNKVCTLKVLADWGANLNKSDKNNKTPAFIAAESGNVEALAFLLDHRVDLSRTDKLYDFTPILIATKNNRVAALNLFANRGIDLNCKNRGYTPAHTAAKYNCIDALTFFADRRIDLNKTSSFLEETPACIAVKNGNIDALVVLADRGANLNKADVFGNTPAYIAAEKGNVNALTVLADRGANLNKVNNNGDTPVFIAAQKDRADVLTLLADRGANFAITNRYNQTPFGIGYLQKHHEILRKLANSQNVILFYSDPKKSERHKHLKRLALYANLEAVVSSKQTNPFQHPLLSIQNRLIAKRISLLRKIQEEVSREAGSVTR